MLSIHPLTSLLTIFALLWSGGLFSGFQQTPPPEPELTLRLRRNFGYSSGTGLIQGAFTLTAAGPADLERVTFYIDAREIGEVDEQPFQLRFNTDNFPLGDHTLQAIGITQGGKELRSERLRVRFVTAEEGWRAGIRIIVPILVVVLGAILLAMVLPLLSLRGKKVDLPAGAPRNYGVFGGAVCKNCSRPFSLHIYGLNMGLWKFDRCPYCGKWGLQKRVDLNTLKAAEEAELKAAGVTRSSGGEKQLEDLESALDDSRYIDL